MYILGISAFYHDSAAALIKDGTVLYAAQEERFTRVKNDSSFPKKAIEFLLYEEGLSLNQVDHIIFYDKPWLKFERIVDGILSFSPKTIWQFRSAMKSWLGEKLNFRKLLKKEFLKIDSGFSQNILFSQHHFSHAASSFYTSPFSDACVVSIDGVGEWDTLSIYDFTAENHKCLAEMKFPNSIGILYSAFTFFCGFKVNSGEYKLMGLAPYGYNTSEFEKKIKEHIVKIHSDGSITLNLDYFKFQYGTETLDRPAWEKLLNLPARTEKDPLTQDYCDFALAAQKVTEEIVLNIIKHSKTLSSSNNLCLAGGVALNCVANSKIRNQGDFEKIWIHPAPGDAGGAIGAALGFYFKDRTYSPSKKFSPYLGPNYSDKEILHELKKYRLEFTKTENKEKKAAELISQSNIIGWFQGRMEWGPRALGNRSILANPLDINMQKDLNLKIKFRENFRPFAPICLADDAHKYFEEDFNNPFMQYVHKVKGFSGGNNPSNDNMTQRLKEIESPLPAITHLDGTARLQTVSKEENEEISKLLEEFESITKYPVLINTSFNVRGEPIVCAPKDAIECFLETEMDYLFMNNFIISKKDNIDIAKKFNKRQFQSD